ncbi:MAG: hypothetical protein ACOCP4_02255 [Candidatus Woesearchaeota archaeon]
MELNKEKVDNIVNTFDIKFDKTDFTIKNFLDSVDFNYLEKLQDLTTLEYIHLFLKLTELYKKNPSDLILNTIFKIFYFYISEDVYIIFYRFLDEINIENKNGLKYLLKEVYCSIYRNGEHFDFFMNQNIKPEYIDVKKYNLSLLKQHLFDYDASSDSKKLEEYLLNNQNLNIKKDFRLYNEKLIYITKSLFNISRIIIYNNATNKEYFFEKIFEKLEPIKNKLLNKIENEKIFKPSITRTYSFLSAYHNIRIKYEMDNRGKNIKKFVDNYFEDYTVLHKYLSPYIQYTLMPRVGKSLIEIVNYYNFLNIDNSFLKTYYNDVIYNLVNKSNIEKISDNFKDYKDIMNRVEVGAIFAADVFFMKKTKHDQFELMRKSGLNFIENMWMSHKEHEELYSVFYPSISWF